MDLPPPGYMFRFQSCRWEAIWDLAIKVSLGSLPILKNFSSTSNLLTGHIHGKTRILWKSWLQPPEIKGLYSKGLFFTLKSTMLLISILVAGWEIARHWRLFWNKLQIQPIIRASYIPNLNPDQFCLLYWFIRISPIRLRHLNTEKNNSRPTWKRNLTKNKDIEVAFVETTRFTLQFEFTLLFSKSYQPFFLQTHSHLSFTARIVCSESPGDQCLCPEWSKWSRRELFFGDDAQQEHGEGHG